MRDPAPRRRRATADAEAFDRRAMPRPWWWRLLLRRPRDTFAFVVAAGAATAVIVNGAYLQRGHHPAPMFAVKPLPVASAEPAQTAAVIPRPRPEITDTARARPAAPATIAGPRRDAIAELLAARSPQAATQPAPQPVSQPVPQPVSQPVPLSPAPPSRSLAQPSRQVLAVQRALSEFGYGQLKPTGVFDPETRLAIQRFERDHKLPITGELSERVAHELATMTGHELN